MIILDIIGAVTLLTIFCAGIYWVLTNVRFTNNRYSYEKTVDEHGHTYDKVNDRNE